ncbi:DinB family protein [Seonamhaeicola maritimus]|uniref:DinB family protein n=1 Tax=Seonamhaeicola maritimus TaxID=2591822 RepID=A0A5C7GE38_9FLAO|nr:DinB family protein [Seonamhaeicola maritimus]TXG34560.1 DinB family protein [Seonamhaeicola maritimus]
MKKILSVLVCFVLTLSIHAQREIKAEEGFTPNVGVLVSMLNDMKNRVEYTVKDLDVESTDFLLDENANSIGTLILHLAATEKFYQVYTFEGREFNDKEKEVWGTKMSMGDEARKQFKGKPISEYLDVFTKVREKTLEYLKEKDDDWLASTPEGYRMNNHWSWYHVMEHQSSHLGQILLIKKRIP